MIEYPEVKIIARQLDEAVSGRKVIEVLPPAKPHRFCFFTGIPEAYHSILKGRRIIGAEGIGFYCQLNFEGGLKLSFRDGVNVRLSPPCVKSGGEQLEIHLDDRKSLLFNVAMYGGIILHEGRPDDKYYLASLDGFDLLDGGFKDNFFRLYRACKPSLSAKAFLATEQRFTGLGNGILQDILLTAKIHPKKPIGQLSEAEVENLADAVVSVTAQMLKAGGRDTEKDLYGSSGGYVTRLSRFTFGSPCPQCGGRIEKQQYLGGAIYFCQNCQQL